MKPDSKTKLVQFDPDQAITLWIDGYPEKTKTFTLIVPADATFRDLKELAKRVDSHAESALDARIVKL
jgi:hypothetical protein